MPLAPNEWVTDTEGVGILLFYGPYKTYHWFCKNCYLNDPRSWDRYTQERSSSLFWVYKDQLLGIRQACGGIGCASVSEGLNVQEQGLFINAVSTLPTPSDLIRG